jgi:hypothetical protein
MAKYIAPSYVAACIFVGKTLGSTRTTINHQVIDKPAMFHLPKVAEIVLLGKI